MGRTLYPHAPARTGAPMLAVMLEIVMFAATLVVVVVAFGLAVWFVSPFGLYLRQVRNRRAADRRTREHCPIHGRQAPASLIRLKSGETVCSQCFEEAMDDVCAS